MRCRSGESARRAILVWECRDRSPIRSVGKGDTYCHRLFTRETFKATEELARACRGVVHCVNNACGADHGAAHLIRPSVLRSHLNLLCGFLVQLKCCALASQRLHHAAAVGRSSQQPRRGVCLPSSHGNGVAEDCRRFIGCAIRRGAIFGTLGLSGSSSLDLEAWSRQGAPGVWASARWAAFIIPHGCI